MTDAWNDLNAALFRSINPYEGFDASRHEIDMQGWNSQHIFLSDAIRTEKPKIVVEVGVWKGGSTIHMAQTMQEEGIDGAVIATDTFLGSWEHYEQEQYFPSLRLVNGYPSLFFTFLSNVVAAGVSSYIQPLPLDSANAFFVLSRKGIQADVVHIDAGHDYDAVLNDLRMWWTAMKPGGLLIADDYDADGVVWPSVRDAVDVFLKSVPHEDFEALPYKARFRKPAGQ